MYLSSMVEKRERKHANNIQTILKDDIDVLQRECLHKLSECSKSRSLKSGHRTYCMIPRPRAPRPPFAATMPLLCGDRRRPHRPEVGVMIVLRLPYPRSTGSRQI